VVELRKEGKVVEVQREKEEEKGASPQPEEEGRQVALKECIQTWNGLIQGLLRAHQSWEKYCQLRIEKSIGLEEFPLEVQKIIYKGHPFGDYALLVEDMCTQPPIADFLKSQLIKT